MVLVPYHSWANRGPSTVRAWLPVVEPQRVIPLDGTSTGK
ncbi:hypothetical protein ACF06V_37585 [Streptomyces bobili]